MARTITRATRQGPVSASSSRSPGITGRWPSHKGQRALGALWQHRLTCGARLSTWVAVEAIWVGPSRRPHMNLSHASLANGLAADKRANLSDSLQDKKACLLDTE